MNKYISGGEGKAHLYSGMLSNKCRRNDGVRKSLMDIKLVGEIRLGKGYLHSLQVSPHKLLINYKEKIGTLQYRNLADTTLGK